MQIAAYRKISCLAYCCFGLGLFWKFF